jgi:hypothetical protein
LELFSAKLTVAMNRRSAGAVTCAGFGTGAKRAGVGSGARIAVGGV